MPAIEMLILNYFLFKFLEIIDVFVFNYLVVLIRQWLFCRRRQFTLRDYFAMSYL